MELLALYWPTILASTFCAGALSCVGAFLVTRQAAVQTLAVSQGAGLGVSLGLLVSQVFFDHGHLEHTALPLSFGLVTGGLGFILTEWAARRSHSPAVIYLGAFAIFWGASQLITGFFPVVETHAMAIYFGDIVTLTKGESFFFFLLAAASSLYLLLNWRKLAERAFLSAILDEPFRLKNSTDTSFHLVSLLLVCFSVQLLGLLFTLSCLFLPTAVYSFSPRAGVGRHLLRVTVAAAIAAMVGFELSLLEPRFLTTPVIALLLCLVPLAHVVGEKILRKIR